MTVMILRKFWALCSLAQGLAILCAGSVRADDADFTLWVKAFIPRDVSIAKDIPDGNGTMIPIFHGQLSRVLGCFDTDQRNFSNDFEASARVTATVSSTAGGESKTGGVCGKTTRRSCKDGTVKKEGSCVGQEAVSIRQVANEDGSREYLITGRAKNPLAPRLAPAIKFSLVVKEVWLDGQVEFSVGGVVGDFPAFESYVSFEGETRTLFVMPPKDGATPVNLVGRPGREVSGSASFAREPKAARNSGSIEEGSGGSGDPSSPSGAEGAPPSPGTQEAGLPSTLPGAGQGTGLPPRPGAGQGTDMPSTPPGAGQRTGSPPPPPFPAVGSETRTESENSSELIERATKLWNDMAPEAGPEEPDTEAVDFGEDDELGGL